MPFRLCKAPLCSSPATYRAYCRRHAQERERAINRPGYSLYRTKRWKLLRKRVLYENPLCQAPGCEDIATDVDHITPLFDGGPPLDRSNLQALCKRHHSLKSRQERARA